MKPITPLRLIVTGSSHGIGRALTTRLVAAGHHVWGLARSDQADLAASLGGNFRATRCDVAQWGSVESAAREVAATWPGVDGLVTCAGILGEVGPLLTADPVRWSATVRTNLDGTFHVLRAFASLLERRARRAKIVCFSGGGATKARPNFSAYGAAKTGVVRMVETLAEEMPGLDVNAVAPGAINTQMTEALIAHGPAIAGQAEYTAALQRLENGGASLNRALELVKFLLSPESDGISGRLISAPWDQWETLAGRSAELAGTDAYKLRRVDPDVKAKP